jgi:hypothetical protein
LRIACLGTFDTVGALGIPTTLLRRVNRQFYEFHDVELSPIVRLNLHALAIDEQRYPFAASVLRQSRFRWGNSVTEQVWFPGVHADVGGGYASPYSKSDNARGLNEITLDWMIKRLRHHYPDFPSLSKAFAPLYEASEVLDELSDDGSKFAVQHDSRTWPYHFYDIAFRAIANRPPRVYQGESVVSYDHSEPVAGESVHISAIERLGNKVRFGNKSKFLYAPRNLIEILPDLHARYCLPSEAPWPHDALAVTVWSGEIVHEAASEDGVKASVKRSILGALERLKKNDISVRLRATATPESEMPTITR